MHSSLGLTSTHPPTPTSNSDPQPSPGPHMGAGTVEEEFVGHPSPQVCQREL